MDHPMSRRFGAWTAHGRRPLAAAFVAGVAAVLAASPVAAQAAVAAAPAAAPSTLPAPTAALTEVTDFGPNPTGLQMFLYVPKSVLRHPAVLVVAHYCTGSGPAMFAGTEYASLADRDGFVVVYPSAPRDGHCFDVSSASALTHNGNSDPVGIVSMVRYVERRLHGDANRVFVTGISSGAMLTNVLLGDYPDVFTAGSAMSGVPFGCFATTDGSMWNSQCANGQIIKTPQEWGGLVRGAFPGYRGPRPRMQLWHGTADTILFYPNFGEEVKEWTDVLHTTRAVTDSPRPTWTHTAYTNRFGQVEVDAYSVAGATHNVAFDEPGLDELAVEFFGLTGHCGHR
jgi:poly(hydroxyalkanoate) depolymerase family esterase